MPRCPALLRLTELCGQRRSFGRSGSQRRRRRLNHGVKRSLEPSEVDIMATARQHRAKPALRIPLRAEQSHGGVEQQRPRLFGAVGQHRFIKHAMGFPGRLFMTLAGYVVNDTRTTVVADKWRPDHRRPDLIRNARAVHSFAAARGPTVPLAIDEGELAQQFHLTVRSPVHQPSGVDVPFEMWCAISHDVSRETTSPRTTEPSTINRPTVTGSLNRRGPALPGFINRTPSRVST